MLVVEQLEDHSRQEPTDLLGLFIRRICRIEDVTHGPNRVWKLDAAVKEAAAEKRQSRQQTLREFAAEAVATELPDLVSQLAELGIAIEESTSVTPVRYPMTESTLKALRHASHWSGLDQSQLFVAYLRLATRRKSRRTATPKS